MGVDFLEEGLWGLLVVVLHFCVFLWFGEIIIIGYFITIRQLSWKSVSVSILISIYISISYPISFLNISLLQDT